MSSDDIIAIEQLLWAYCHRVDRGSAAEVAALFAADGVLIPKYDGDYECRGRAEVERWYAYYHEHFRASVQHLKHMVSAPLIELDGARASGCCYLLATLVDADGTSGSYATGTYHDSYCKVDGRWLFASRTIEVEWAAPHTTVVARFPPLGFSPAGQ
ncbi:MAG: nuclear transport factor 2 family protein [Gammaproteobacteria bacterium]|nr:nuclear transport factor 2 family protein [Gammaproteobacteria bacterium]MCP5198712.1 nuclear transport factor 2 family protein [Gammaproteobacteria bacterium]